MSQEQKTDQAEVYSCPTELYKSDCAPPAEVEAHKNCVSERCLEGPARSTFHAYLEPAKASNFAAPPASTARFGGPPRSKKSSRGGRTSRSKRSGHSVSTALTPPSAPSSLIAPSASNAPTASSASTAPAAPTISSVPKFHSTAASQSALSSSVQWTGPIHNANDSDGEL